MKLLRNILLPFVPIYYLITYVRNWLFDINFLKSKAYNLPIICVGNLSVGGTGKTPMVEYLLTMLSNKYKVATLSRGYKRVTSGFILADENISVSEIGDEPFQFYEKFKSKVSIAVDANRQRGIEELIDKVNPEVLILDDAFQHRKVKAGLNILLTTYNNLYVDDFLLPTGNLRESSSGASRADIIVVTKCPDNLLEEEKSSIQSKLNIQQHQELFFSSIVYGDKIINGKNSLEVKELKNKKFTLVTGIANPIPLVDFLKNKGLDFEHLVFPDHHNFSQAEIKAIQSKDLVVTTEKDFMRLKEEDSLKSNLYYLPITFGVSNTERFQKKITDFIII